MKKGFIILTGIYIILLGILGFLFFLLTPHAANFNPWDIPCIYVPILAWFLATGIGLIVNKDWARYSLLVMSGLAILIYVILVWYMFSMPFHLITNIILSVILAFFLILLPVFYFIFFTQENVIALFDNSAPIAQQQFKRPVGIGILAFFLLFLGLMALSNLLHHSLHGVPFLGVFFISGWGYTLHNLIMVIVYCYIAYGFWRLFKSAWYTCVGLTILELINSIIMIFTLNEATFRKIGFTSKLLTLTTYRWSYGIVLLYLTGILIYVVQKRNWFFPNNNPTSSEGVDVNQ